jgi:hypothetical protein
MFFNLLSHPDIGIFISLFITASFVAAFAFAYKNWRHSPSVFITSSILFINFVLANNALYEFVESSNPDIANYYLNWVGYNALTIIAIIVVHIFVRTKHHKITITSMYLLLVNVIMYLAMHNDIILNGNREPWLLWSLYTPVVNITEIGLAFMLITHSVYFLYFKQHKTQKEIG